MLGRGTGMREEQKNFSLLIGAITWRVGAVITPQDPSSVYSILFAAMGDGFIGLPGSG